ncbi:hypothetical protein, partial [Acinetobacter baumannii]|uniref:hypothetical protein n=1 Tax=Acinetobacter baumannii TaxID=470 RepID=UPI00339A7AD9
EGPATIGYINNQWKPRIRLAIITNKGTHNTPGQRPSNNQHTQPKGHLPKYNVHNTSDKHANNTSRRPTEPQ